jgi:crotonobetainyl-CoA:carnitine CoA-transferase CaiB-like acyl-CoA transferase
MLANPARLSATPPSYDRPPPRLGEHTDEVLSEVLGLSGAEIAALRDAEIV